MQKQTGGCSGNSTAAATTVNASDEGDKEKTEELAQPETTSFQEWARAGDCNRLVVRNAAVPCAGQA